MRRRRKYKEKVDLNNQDLAKLEEMISGYNEMKKQEVPLRINDKLIIFVPSEKCNDQFRQWYIKNRLK